MRKSLLVSLVLSTSAAVYAQDATIYRWVDNNNVVHFSHEHPKDKDYAQIDVKVSYASSQKGNNADKENAADKLALSPDTSDLSSKSAEAVKKNCLTAQENLKTLQQFDNVHIQDLEGNQRLLTKEEKEEQITLSEKYVSVFCEDPSKQ